MIFVLVSLTPSLRSQSFFVVPPPDPPVAHYFLLSLFLFCIFLPTYAYSRRQCRRLRDLFTPSQQEQTLSNNPLPRHDKLRMQTHTVVLPSPSPSSALVFLVPLPLPWLVHTDRQMPRPHLRLLQIFSLPTTTEACRPPSPVLLPLQSVLTGICLWSVPSPHISPLFYCHSHISLERNALPCRQCFARFSCLFSPIHL